MRNFLKLLTPCCFASGYSLAKFVPDKTWNLHFQSEVGWRNLLQISTCMKLYKPTICVRKVEIVFVTVFPLRIRQPRTKIAATLVSYSSSRYITILYYLNDVEEGGETAFPVADNDTFDQAVS